MRAADWSNVAGLVAAVLGLGAPLTASAQYGGAAPMYGTTSVYGSPATLSGVAGGATSFASIDSNCWGYGNVAPSHVVMTGGGTFRFTGSSSGDTTMMVMGPDGRRYCDDDGGGYPNPQVDITVGAGPITVWVGTYSSGGTYPYTVSVTPMGGGGGGGYGYGYGGGGGSLYGNATYPGGTDPVLLSGIFGGPVDADTMGSCAGYIPATPSHVITVTTYVPNLRFVVRGDADTVLVVRWADGRVDCNDDGGGYPHPLVTGNATPGSILVYVGSYGSGSTGGYTLGVTTNPGISASNLGMGGTPPVVVAPPVVVPPVVVPPTPPVVVTPPSGAIRVDLDARIPVTLFGAGVTPTVAVWSPRGGPAIEVSAMPSGSGVSIAANVGGVMTSIVDVPSSIASGSTVAVTELRNRRLVVRAESVSVGSAMVWLLDYAGGAVTVENTWTGSLSDRGPRWAR